MYKKTLINLTALTLAMSMAFGPAVTTFAADNDTVITTDAGTSSTDTVDDTTDNSDVDETVVIERDPESKAYYRTSETEQETVIINVPEGAVMNADSKENSTVYAQNNSNVTVNGDVNSENFRGANAQPGSTITVNGDVTSEYKGAVTTNGTVVVNGDVSGDFAGISVLGEDGKITVNGDVSADGYKKTNDETIGDIDKTENKEIRKYASKEGSAIRTDGAGEIHVTGDAIGLNEGVYIVPKVNGEGGKIVVEGTLGSINDLAKSDRYNGTDLYADKSKNDFSATGETAEEIARNLIKAFPEIYAYHYLENGFSIVYSLKNNNESDESTVTYQDVYEVSNKLISDKLNYIIHTEGDVKFEDGFKTVDIDNKTITAMAENAIMKVAVADGYTLAGNDAVTVTDNGDGTFSVKLAKVYGGIVLSAVLKPVVVTNENNEQTVVYVASETAQETETTGTTQTNSDVQENVVRVPFVVATFTVSDGNVLPDVLGASREDGASETVVSAKQVIKVAAGELTAIEYKNAFISSVKNAPLNGIVRVETATPTCFDKMMLQVLATRPDLTLEVSFPINKENVELTVPAGYDVMSLLDANGYCGFLYLNSVFANAQ